MADAGNAPSIFVLHSLPTLLPSTTYSLVLCALVNCNSSSRRTSHVPKVHNHKNCSWQFNRLLAVSHVRARESPPSCTRTRTLIYLWALCCLRCCKDCRRSRQVAAAALEGLGFDCIELQRAGGSSLCSSTRCTLQGLEGPLRGARPGPHTPSSPSACGNLLWRRRLA